MNDKISLEECVCRLQYIENGTREEDLSIISAIKSEYGEDGHDAALEFWMKYDGTEGDFRSVWKSIKQCKSGIGTIIYKSRMAGYNNSGAHLPIQTPQTNKQTAQTPQTKLDQVSRPVKVVNFNEKYNSIECGDPTYLPYCIFKMFNPPCKSYDGALHIPVYNKDNDITGIQTIRENKAGEFEKRFEYGSEFSGCFAKVGFDRLEDVKQIIVCEGYATGNSLLDIFNMPVACALSAGNMKNVVEVITGLGIPVTIAADNDWEKSVNTGLDGAKNIVDAGYDCQIIHTPNDNKITDFNDYIVEYGKDKSRENFSGLIEIKIKETEKDKYRREFGIYEFDPDEIIEDGVDIVEGIIPETGISLFAAPPSSGKSTLFSTLAVMMAGGHKSSKKKVLYIAAEASKIVRKMMQASAREIGLPDHDNLDIVDDAILIKQGMLEDVIRTGEYQVVFIDTFTKATAGLDENSASDMNGFFASLENIATKYNMLFITANHVGKDSEDGHKSKIRGSTVFEDAAYTYHSLKRDGKTVTGQCYKNKHSGRLSHFSFEIVQQEQGGVFAGNLHSLDEDYFTNNNEENNATIGDSRFSVVMDRMKEIGRPCSRKDIISICRDVTGELEPGMSKDEVEYHAEILYNKDLKKARKIGFIDYDEVVNGYIILDKFRG